MALDFNSTLIQAITGTVIGGLFLLLIAYLAKQLRQSGRGIIARFRQRTREETGLESYRSTLEKETLLFSRPWMKEDQRLGDVPVPITFESGGRSENEELETYIAHGFRQDRSSRLMSKSGGDLSLRWLTGTSRDRRLAHGFRTNWTCSSRRPD